VTQVAASVAVNAGNNQSATISSAFAVPMSVIVRDAASNPVPGVTVTFTAPGSGASGTFAGGSTAANAVANGSGIATAPAFTANALAGSYSVSVTAGALSTSFSLTNGKGANTITFPLPPDTPFTGITPTLTATSSSGLGVTYSSDTPGTCSVSPGGSLTFLAAGLCSIAADQAGNANFEAATTVVRSFSITPGENTITFPQPTDTPFSSTPPTLTATASSGLAVTYGSTTPGVCTVTSGGILGFVSTGTCTITADQAGNANYDAAAQVTQSFTVTPGVNTITFPQPANAAFTSAPPALTATASSGLSVTYGSTTPGVCTVTSGGAITFVSAGTCTIAANQSGSAIYDAAAEVTRSFTVNPGVNTISFPQPADTPFTSTPPTLAATASSGLSISYGSTTQGVCTVTAGGILSFVSAGTCSIQANQPGDSNYVAAAQVSRSFNVTPGVNTITFPQPADTPLTSPPPSLSATASSSLGVSYSSSTTGVCTVTSGGSLAFVSAGTCTIAANQPGNGNFEAASPVTRSFNVTKGVNTITFPQPPSTPFSSTPPALTATASSGLSVTYGSTTTGVCSVTSGGALTFVTAGTCTIAADQAGNANFLPATQVIRSFAITQGATTTTVSSSSSSVLMGESITLTANVTPTIAPGTVSFIDGVAPLCTNVALVAGTASCTTSFSAAGNHSITARYNGSVSYAASTSPAITIAVTDQRLRTVEAIGNYLSLRNDMILSHAPDAGRQIDRLSMWQGDGNADAPGFIASTASRGFSSGGNVGLQDVALGMTIPASGRSRGNASGQFDQMLDRMGLNDWNDDTTPGEFHPQFGSLHGSGDSSGHMNLSFATSLNQILKSAAGQGGDRLGANESGDKLPGLAPSRFDVWLQGEYATFTDDRNASGSEGHFGVVYLGADYVARPWLLVGALVQYDDMKQTSTAVGYETQGSGWTAGPYATVRLAPSLFWQARMAWGQSSNEVSPFLTYTDSFDSTRWLVSSDLTGNWESGSWQFRPSASFAYIEDTSDSYLDHFAVLIPSVSTSLGQFKAEPQVSYVRTLANGTRFEPHLAASAIWNFESSGSAAGFGGTLVGPEELRGKIEAGVGVHFINGITLDVAASYDGIGSQDYEASSVSAGIRVPMN
jgi:outer membrane autotransporter protein